MGLTIDNERVVTGGLADPEIRRHHVTFSDGTEGDVLPEGIRVRSIQHPELAGYIKHWEWNKSIGRGDRANVLSPIPYCIGWDDSARAYELLGFMFVYASDRSVEPER